MTIAFACDHGGFSFREEIISHLKNLGHDVVDKWPSSFQELDDFPDYSTKVCDTILSGEAQRGIRVCVVTMMQMLPVFELEQWQ